VTRDKLLSKKHRERLRLQATFLWYQNLSLRFISTTFYEDRSKPLEDYRRYFTRRRNFLSSISAKYLL